MRGAITSFIFENSRKLPGSMNATGRSFYQLYRKDTPYSRGGA